MNLTTITMDPAEAGERAEGYRRLAVPTVEEKQILAGFLALAAGKQLIRLADTVIAGGCDSNGWPRLAVMRANETWCHLSASKVWGGEPGVRWTFAPESWMDGRYSRSIFRFSGPSIEDVAYCHGDRRAMVPIIPPELRPRHGTRLMKLDNFLVLWEVEQWELAPRPPGDPALLRHIGGDLYTVEAVWDLTELEQAVLAGRNGRDQ